MKKLLFIISLALCVGCQKEEVPQEPTAFELCKTYEGKVPQMTDVMADPETGLIQGDIIPDIKQGKAALVDKKWPDRVIPFYLQEWSKDHNNIVTMGFRGEDRDIARFAFIDAAEGLGFEAIEYENRTELLKHHKGGVKVEPGAFGVSSSHVGYQGTIQPFKIAYNWEVVPHEMFHLVGGIHEHSRPGRDKHIKVNFDNIYENRHGQFAEDVDVRSYGEIDFNSVSIYPSYLKSIAKDTTLPIMEKLDGSTWVNNFWYSECDLNAVNALYAKD